MLSPRTNQYIYVDLIGRLCQVVNVFLFTISHPRHEHSKNEKSTGRIPSVPRTEQNGRILQQDVSKEGKQKDMCAA
jgi:hypothetical protein